jgi:hypothetical protein
MLSAAPDEIKAPFYAHDFLEKPPIDEVPEATVCCAEDTIFLRFSTWLIRGSSRI